MRAAAKCQNPKLRRRNFSNLVNTRPTVALHLANKAPHQMTLPVQVRVVQDYYLPVGTPWHHRCHPQLGNPLPQPLGIVPFVRNHILAGVAGPQRFGLGNVILLASRQDKTQRIVQPVHCDVHFGTEPAPAAP